MVKKYLKVNIWKGKGKVFKDFDEKKYFVGEYLNGKKWKGKFIKIKNDKIKCKAV